MNMAWLIWSYLCKPKREGGLGFHDLRAFNIALLSKQFWRLMTCPDSLMARIFQAKYYRNSTFFDWTKGARPSSTWTSILHATSAFIFSTPGG